jgi:hypothetical protein
MYIQKDNFSYGVHGLGEYALNTNEENVLTFASYDDLKKAYCIKELPQAASDYIGYFKELIDRNQLRFGVEIFVWGIDWDIYKFKVFLAVTDTTNNFSYLIARDRNSSSGGRWFFTPICIIEFPMKSLGQLSLVDPMRPFKVGMGEPGTWMPYHEIHPVPGISTKGASFSFPDSEFIGWYNVQGTNIPQAIFKFTVVKDRPKVCAFADTYFATKEGALDNGNTTGGWVLVNCPATPGGRGGSTPLPGDYGTDSLFKGCPQCNSEFTYTDKQTAIGKNDGGIFTGDLPVLFVDNPSGISEFTNVKYGRIKYYKQSRSENWFMEWDKGFCLINYKSPAGTNIPPPLAGNCAAKIPPVEIGTNPLIVNVPFVTSDGCDCETVTEQVKFFIGDEKPQGTDFIEIPYTQTSEECITDPNAPKGTPNLDCDTIKKIFESKGMPLAGLGNCQNLRGLRGLSSDKTYIDPPPEPDPNAVSVKPEESDSKMYWIAGGSILGGIILASVLAGKLFKQ